MPNYCGHIRSVVNLLDKFLYSPTQHSTDLNLNKNYRLTKQIGSY